MSEKVGTYPYPNLAIRKGVVDPEPVSEAYGCIKSHCRKIRKQADKRPHIFGLSSQHFMTEEHFGIAGRWTFRDGVRKE